MHLAVETDRLRRVYTTRAANGRKSTLVVLDNVTLSVRRGELFGLLGVNGAGKSTLLQILGAQLRPRSGTAKVAGFDVCRYASYVRRYVGVVCVDDGPILRLRTWPKPTSCAIASPFSTADVSLPAIRHRHGRISGTQRQLFPTLAFAAPAALEAAFLAIVGRGAWADA